MMKTRNKTPTEENAVKIAIIKLRAEMRDHSKLKNLDPRKELNYVFTKLEEMLNL